jgi:hypothetical protein
VFVKLNELWRVGYHDDPLSVSIEYQGNGRFDDPQRERTVLYGSDTIETCIIENALPWSLHPDASYVQRTEAPERDADSELQQAELDDAERDRVIAMKPGQMPTDLYHKAKVYVALSEPIVVLDLDDISVRRDLAQISEIAAKMREHDLPDLDRSVLTGRHLDLTRTISGYLMRRPFGGHDFAGVRALSRHAGTSYVLFEGRYRLGTRLVGAINLSPEDPDVIKSAQRLRLVP